MKKLINKIGIIIFSLAPLVAIASTPSSSPTSVSPQFELAQSFKTKLRRSFKNSKWASQTKSNSGSKITNGEDGIIFEDSRGNLWSMGPGTPLQKYNYQTEEWTVETSGSSGSNITDGYNGTIFEDSRGNLWSMGTGTPLQKYNYQKKRWATQAIASSDTSGGSNIIDGAGGTIFEDSRGNLWSMGPRTPLQKYDYKIKKWTTETIESSGSNITNGYNGTIFEDSRGNLWSMGWGTSLQKYDYKTKKWTTETSGSSGSNITDGYNGTIFEDSRGNLWSMGTGTPLQKYDYKTKKWIAKTSESSNIISGFGGTIFEDTRGNLWSMGNRTLLQKYDYKAKKWTTETRASSNSNITNGLSGTIFEDSRGNLWSMGINTPLQKYNYQTKKWTIKNSNITDGNSGTIFEDSRGNLWSMGSSTPLQKYDYQTKKWATETRNRKNSSGSNIVSGLSGTIFEDSRGNLWSMGYKTPLQKLVPINVDSANGRAKETSTNGQNVKDFDIEFKTRINKDSKIAILIKGYRQYTSSLFSHLQYKKKTELDWKIVKKRTLILDAAEYEFKWVLGAEEILASGQKFPQKITIKSDGSVKTITSTQPSDNAEVKNFLNSLSNQTLNSLANNSKLVGAITKLEVLALIQVASGYNALTSTQKALIAAEDLILLTEDPAGTLKVTITFKGETYELIKAGFNKLSLKTEANKFQDFTSTDTIQSNVASLRVSSKDVLSIFKKIGGYQSPTNWTSDIAITKVIVKKPLNLQTQKMTFELTISRQKEEVKKDVTVTFQALKIIPKTNKKGLFGLSTGAIVGTSLGSIFGIGITSFLIFYFARRNKK